MADRLYVCDKIRSNLSLPDHGDPWSIGWRGACAMNGTWPVSART